MADGAAGPGKLGRWTEGRWSGATQYPSPHEGPRPEGTSVDLVVLHAISLPPGVYGGPGIEQLFMGRLDPSGHPYYASLEGLRVSAHFVIRRSGLVMQFVGTDRRAWHAGVSSWLGRSNCNDFSIGIELEGLDGQRFTAAQYRKLPRLIAALAQQHPLRWIAGHEHVAPGRKHDPGAGFDWHILRCALDLQPLTAGFELPQDVGLSNGFA